VGSKCARRNKEAANDLSEHSAEVVKLIVNHIYKAPPAWITRELEKDAPKLKNALEEIDQYVHSEAEKVQSCRLHMVKGSVDTSYSGIERSAKRCSELVRRFKNPLR